jgi:hypothetical protein
MKEEHEIEILIEEKSKELKRFDVPPDLWINIKRELDSTPEKRENIISTLAGLLSNNRLKLAYTFIFVIISLTALYILNGGKDEIVAPKIASIESRVDSSDKVSPQTNTANYNDTKPRVVYRNISKEKRISSLEKKVDKKIESIDSYAQTVYKDKIAELNESITECKKFYASDYNEMIKKNLAMVYDEKLKLLLDILKVN